MTSPFNPYQAPIAESLPSVAAGDFDIGRCVTDAFERMKQNPMLPIGVLIVGQLLMMISMFTVVGIFLALPVFVWGLTKFFLNLHDQRQPQTNDLFAGFANYWTVVGRVLLVLVSFFLLALLGESAMLVGEATKSVPLSVIGFLVYLSFFLFVLSRFYFALFFVVDRNLPALEAMSASWRLLQGKSLKMAGFVFVAALVSSAGVLALCIGILFTIPMSYLMYVSAYRQAAGYGPPPGQA